MSDFSVLITPPGPGRTGTEPLEFATPDMATSLVVADLNLDGGTAEVRHDGLLVATLKKLGEDGPPVWLVNQKAV